MCVHSIALDLCMHSHTFLRAIYNLYQVSSMALGTRTRIRVQHCIKSVLYVMSKLSYIIDFFLHRFLSLYMVKEGGTRKTYAVIDAPVHREHNGASYNSV